MGKHETTTASCKSLCQLARKRASTSKLSLLPKQRSAGDGASMLSGSRTTTAGSSTSKLSLLMSGRPSPRRRLSGILNRSAGRLEMLQALRNSNVTTTRQPARSKTTLLEKATAAQTSAAAAAAALAAAAAVPQQQPPAPAPLRTSQQQTPQTPPPQPQLEEDETETREVTLSSLGCSSSQNFFLGLDDSQSKHMVHMEDAPPAIPRRVLSKPCLASLDNAAAPQEENNNAQDGSEQGSSSSSPPSGDDRQAQQNFPPAMPRRSISPTNPPEGLEDLFLLDVDDDDDDDYDYDYSDDEMDHAPEVRALMFPNSQQPIGSPFTPSSRELHQHGGAPSTSEMTPPAMPTRWTSARHLCVEEKAPAAAAGTAAAVVTADEEEATTSTTTVATSPATLRSQHDFGSCSEESQHNASFPQLSQAFPTPKWSVSPFWQKLNGPLAPKRTNYDPTATTTTAALDAAANRLVASTTPSCRRNESVSALNFASIRLQSSTRLSAAAQRR